MKRIKDSLQEIYKLIEISKRNGVDYILINSKDLPKPVKEDLVLAGYTVKKGFMGTTIIKWK